MKKIICCILTAVLLLCTFCGCSNNKDSSSAPIDSGVYKLTSTTETQGEYVFTPYLSLDTVPNSPNSFIFYYDSLSSYMPTGTYTFEDGKVVCNTSDGMFTYSFNIIDSNTVAFDAANSSAIIYIDPSFAGSAPITDGAVFELVGE